MHHGEELPILILSKTEYFGEIKIINNCITKQISGRTYSVYKFHF